MSEANAAKTVSTACPDIGIWRSWLDQELESEQRTVLESHLHSCPACRDAVAQLRHNAAAAHSAMSALAPASVPSRAESAVARQHLAWHRRAPAAQTKANVPVRMPRISRGWRIAASGIAAAVVVSFAVAYTPEGRAAAAGFLAQFRSQQVAAIEITPQSQADIMRTFDALNDLGVVQGATSNQVRANERAATEQSLTLEQASQQVGFTVKTPDGTTLPQGLNGTPRITVTPPMQERFTFSKDKAAKYFQSTGHPEVSLPDKFDGATLVVSIPAAAMLQYGNSSSRDALVIGQAGEIEIDVQGNASLSEMRDFLLSLPGLPAQTVAQLRQIQNWNETLPIPVPVDKVHWQSVTFPNGGQGLVLDDNSGVGSAAVWHQGGRLYGVAGSLKATDLRRVADSLASH
jgi:anti-sigma factor RsiW